MAPSRQRGARALAAPRWLCVVLLRCARGTVAPRPSVPEVAGSSIEERSVAFHRDTKWHRKYNESFCEGFGRDVVGEGEPLGDARVAWLVVCTPPSCHRTLPVLRALASRTALPVVVVETLGGHGTSMRGQSRSRKVRMLREYLGSAVAARVEHVVYSDAMDVIANGGGGGDVLAALARVGGDRLLVSGEPACWVGDVCDEAEVAEMRRRAPAHFAKRGSGYANASVFVNSGQYAGSRGAVLAFLDYAIATLDFMEAHGNALPPDVEALFSDRRGDLARAGGFHCSDQCVLTAYWMTHVDRVAVDVDAAVFGSLKGFYVLEDDDRGLRGALAANATRGGARPRLGAPVPTSAWASLPEARWPAASPYAADDPPPKCHWLEDAPKRFAGGAGRFCADYDDVADDFAWTCDAAAPGAKGIPTLAFRGEAPLLGWHGNGRAPTHFFQSLLADLCYGRVPCAAVR